MSAKHRKRRKRRQNKQALKFGKSAKPTHMLKAARTGAKLEHNLKGLRGKGKKKKATSVH